MMKFLEWDWKESTWRDTAEYLNTPEGKARRRERGKVYKNGYWHAIRDVVKYLEKGATCRQLDRWLWGKLYDWWCHASDTGAYWNPPMIVPWRELRKAVLDAHDNICIYCGETANQCDHVVPVYHWGDYEPENLVAACRRCNFKKNKKMLYETDMKMQHLPSKHVEIVQHYDWLEAKVVP